MIPKLLRAGRVKILTATALLTLLTTLADWATGDNISLAVLYILPTMLAAIVLPATGTAAFAILCAYMRSWFDVPGAPADLALRFIFAALAYFVSGMFVAALVRNHQQATRHLQQIDQEQSLRRDAENQLRALAESSPAAIFTVNGEGTVLSANAAADRLFLVENGGQLQGRAIEDYLPTLRDALRWKRGEAGLRTATQCLAYRDSGEVFQAQIWFSSYSTDEGIRLAAIVVDSTEEMREREQQGSRHLFAGNRIATAAIAHEVRNFCEAMAMLCRDLRERRGLTDDEGLRGLDTLVGGLESIASLELKVRAHEPVEQIDLREVLDNLRVIIEPDWLEIGAAVQWQIPEEIPLVWADPHGLLQACLNLAQNSHRAVQEAPQRELSVRVTPEANNVILSFEDSGPGVRHPERLFELFHDGAKGSGLGLYVSRSIVRSYGGELKYQPGNSKCCFTIELSAN